MKKEEINNIINKTIKFLSLKEKSEILKYFKDKSIKDIMTIKQTDNKYINFITGKIFSEVTIPDATDIIGELNFFPKYKFKDITKFRKSTYEEDIYKKTDRILIMKTDKGNFAFRGRRSHIIYRELTLRDSELKGLFKGFCKWYFYYWTYFINNDLKIKEWILIDMDIIRKNKVMEKHSHMIENKDKTKFIHIELKYLKTKEYDSIVDCYLLPKNIPPSFKYKGKQNKLI